MIQIRGVTKQIGSKLILEELNLEIAKGQTVGLIGANGAGKTTLFSLLSTITKPTTGDILVHGHSVLTQTKTARQYIGYVPQEIALHTSLSVWDNLNFWAQLAPKPITKDKIREVAAQVGLNDRLQERVVNLSGGYKRRVNMAVALLHDPSLLLMDEPTVGVDIYAKRELLPLMRTWKDEGRTIIYSSHDAEEIIYLADRVIMLNEGKLVFDGDMEQARLKLDILQQFGQDGRHQ